jgi:hypothetical protein
VTSAPTHILRRPSCDTWLPATASWVLQNADGFRQQRQSVNRQSACHPAGVPEQETCDLMQLVHGVPRAT